MSSSSIGNLSGGFFVGLHQPSDAQWFNRCCISVNRLRARKKRFGVQQWIMDSGAFTEISTYGEYRCPVSVYAQEVSRWKDNGDLLAAVSQDYMCEPFILKRTGKTVQQHQKLTIARYTTLSATDVGVYVMPVLQGYDPLEYQHHIKAYGDLLVEGAWVGVGSVCKRNSNPKEVANVLRAIRAVRPDLRLHGFGVKVTSLESREIIRMLWSADSMAWSFAARREHRNANDWREAEKFKVRIEGVVAQQLRQREML